MALNRLGVNAPKGVNLHLFAYLFCVRVGVCSAITCFTIFMLDLNHKKHQDAEKKMPVTMLEREIFYRKERRGRKEEKGIFYLNFVFCFFDPYFC